MKVDVAMHWHAHTTGVLSIQTKSGKQAIQYASLQYRYMWCYLLFLALEGLLGFFKLEGLNSARCFTSYRVWMGGGIHIRSRSVLYIFMNGKMLYNDWWSQEIWRYVSTTRSKGSIRKIGRVQCNRRSGWRCTYVYIYSSTEHKNARIFDWFRFSLKMKRDIQGIHFLLLRRGVSQRDTPQNKTSFKSLRWQSPPPPPLHIRDPTSIITYWQSHAHSSDLAICSDMMRATNQFKQYSNAKRFIVPTGW